jgi:hypothetical protein
MLRQQLQAANVRVITIGMPHLITWPAHVAPSATCQSLIGLYHFLCGSWSSCRPRMCAWSPSESAILRRRANSAASPNSLQRWCTPPIVPPRTMHLGSLRALHAWHPRHFKNPGTRTHIPGPGPTYSNPHTQTRIHILEPTYPDPHTQTHTHIPKPTHTYLSPRWCW